MRYLVASAQHDAYAALVSTLPEEGAALGSSSARHEVQVNGQPWAEDLVLLQPRGWRHLSRQPTVSGSASGLILTFGVVDR
jgi:hypothetical protein